MITSRECEDINKNFAKDGELQRWINRIQEDEPFLYSWMINHARSAIEGLTKSGLKATALLTIHNHICLGYVFMYALSKGHKDEVFEKILSNDQFQQFVEGKADEKFYQYPLEGLSEDSTLFQAKMASLRNGLQSVRKAILPYIAEDVAMGQGDPESLRQIAKEIDGHTI